MVWDIATNNASRLIVLDRGSHGGGARSQIIIVTIEPTLAVEASPQLTDVVEEPTAIVMDSTGQLIVADAKEASSAANLLLINPDDWSVNPLLDEENPLIFPTGLAWENPQSLIICDMGVEKLAGSESRAEPATLYRVDQLDLSQEPPRFRRIRQITEPGKLVAPSKIALDPQGQIIIADRGAEYDFDVLGQKREWRIRDNEFGVIVDFSQQRSIEDKKKNQILFQITQIIQEQKPGNTSGWVQF